MSQELRYLIKNKIQCLKSNQPKTKLKNVYYKYKEIIDKYTLFMTDKTKYIETVYCFVYNITEIPKCQHCKINNVKFKSFFSGYRNYCCVKCGVKDNMNTKMKTQLKNINFVSSKNINKDIIFLQDNNVKFTYEYIYNLYKEQIDKHKFLSSNQNNYDEIIYCHINNLTEIPKCLYCGNNVKFDRFRSGYREFCNISCVNKSSITRDKIAETYFQKTGYYHNWSNPECINKIKNERFKKTGYKNALQNPKIKQKAKNTYKEKTGYDNPSQNPKIKQQKINTTMKNYGVEYTFQNKEMLKKRESNYLEKHGVSHQMLNKKVIDKMKNNYFKKYGVYHPMQNKKIVGSFYISKQEIIKRSNIKFNNMFNIKFIGEFEGLNSIITIICSTHGIIKTTARKHLCSVVGCEKCTISAGELSIQNILTNNNINFISEKRFDECRNILPLPFDFYLPDHNICIEFDGEHHFEFVEHFHQTYEKFKSQLLRDKLKTEYCKNNNIQLIRIPYWEFDNIEEILLSKLY